MLGPAKPRDLNRPAVVSLERRVAPAHFYRHLDAALDLSVDRSWVADCYADRGRLSIDSDALWELFFEGILSEWKRLEPSSRNLAHRWYLGYHLNEPLPEWHKSSARFKRAAYTSEPNENGSISGGVTTRVSSGCIERAPQAATRVP